MVLLYQAGTTWPAHSAWYYINLQNVFFFDTPKNPDHVLPDRIYSTM